MSENIKAGFVGGLIAGCILTGLVARCVINHEYSLALDDGRKVGACEAKGGRIVDGVCAKVEEIK